MKRVRLHKRDFPGQPALDEWIPLTQNGLYRAAIAAGNNVANKPTTVAAKADIQMRFSALLSALDMMSSVPKPTQEFLKEGSTAKGVKSNIIANTLCAHSAMLSLNIPWLVDVERLAAEDDEIQIHRDASGLRPDYLGLDLDGHWHVFESKGRSSRPGEQQIARWKQQARSITHVNGERVRHHIVSASYLSPLKEWEVLWVDPEPQRVPAAIEINLGRFFQLYYKETICHWARHTDMEDFGDAVVAPVAASDRMVGLHPTVLEALLSPILRDSDDFGHIGRQVGLLKYAALLLSHQKLSLWPKLQPEGFEPIWSFAQKYKWSAYAAQEAENIDPFLHDTLVFKDGIVVLPHIN
jgi:hypothetical protein